MASLAYLARWWLAAELIGLVALPLSFRVFRRLPDRGYALARVLGLAVLIYVLWLGGTAGVLPFSTGSVLLGLGGLALAGLWLYGRDREQLHAWFRAHSGYVIWCEAIFVVALLLVGLLRSYQPAIAATEKPFEFANYNAVTRAADFAPTDPWLAGKPMAYYYGGYVGLGAVAKLTATPASYAFNVGLALTAALVSLAIFGLAANAAAMLRPGSSLKEGWPLGAGLLAVVLLMVIGNLAGVFEFTAAHGWLPAGFYSHLDILGLGPADVAGLRSPHWWPENFFGSSWRPTRLGSNWNFLEFPSFSFLLGDLHPHVLALPFKVLAAAFGLALLLADELPRPGRWRGGLSLYLLAVLSIGLLIFVHPWDFPVFATLAVLMIVARWFLRRDVEWPVGALQAGGVVALGLLGYAPYFFSASGSVQSPYLQPTEVFFRHTEVAGLTAEGMFLPFQHFLLFWTPLMLPSALFVWYCLANRGWRGLRRNGLKTLSAVALLPLAWALAVLARHGTGGLRAELEIRGPGWLTVVVTGLLLAATLAALLDEALAEREQAGQPARIFLLGAIAVGVLLVYGPELFYIRDSSLTRANTTFKLWYCAWTLLSVSGAVGGLYTLAQWRPALPVARRLLPVAAGLSAAVFAGSLVYPAYASFNRTNAFKGDAGQPRTLDGLAFLKQTDGDEYGAVAWLNGHVPGVTTVLEAYGDSYSFEGRIASRTGLPSVIDWEFHEQQQRSQQPYFEQRRNDVGEIYQTSDIRRAFDLLTRYGVGYVVVGNPERMVYGSGGLAKFAQMGDAVYQSHTVTIYRIVPPPLYATSP
ncbi:MAG TPA: DUF2298 domain-containing protein [Dehalococcoidia bacterium]|nr:DUF2298 domain-containing protein [Dehalococcoidia bacterium]